MQYILVPPYNPPKNSYFSSSTRAQIVAQTQTAAARERLVVVVLMVANFYVTLFTRWWWAAASLSLWQHHNWSPFFYFTAQFERIARHFPPFRYEHPTSDANFFCRFGLLQLPLCFGSSIFLPPETLLKEEAPAIILTINPISPLGWWCTTYSSAFFFFLRSH